MRSPGRKPKFSEPRYFDYLPESKRWTCNACTSSASRDDMTAQAALKHEKAPEHRENIRAREEWGPPQAVDAWINGTDDHIDQLRDFIPFWRRTIEAAEYGETLRFEDFLNALQKDKVESDWNLAPMPGWAMEPLDPLDVEQQSGETERARLWDSGQDVDRDAFDFVEKIARMNSADADRKKRLHSFYKISTSEKVKRIYELIDVLRKA